LCICSLFSGELAKHKCDRTVLRKKYGDLREIIEVDSGLLDTLLDKKVLSREHVAELAKTPYNKTDKLLDFLLFRYVGDYSEVLAALVLTSQEHVVNFISLAGGMYQFLELSVSSADNFFG
jgi:hypothetical protein